MYHCISCVRCIFFFQKDVVFRNFSISNEPLFYPLQGSLDRELTVYYKTDNFCF